MKTKYALLILLVLVMVAALAMSIMPAIVRAEAIGGISPAYPTDPFSWAQLGTIAGATAAVLIIVQFLKFPLDRVWKIPTRILVYLIAVVIMMLATAFSGSLTAESALLAAVNAFIVSLSAYGAYELTFGKRNSEDAP